MSHAHGLPAQSTQENFAKALRPFPTYSDLLVARRRLLPFDEIKVYRCNFGDLCCLATGSRPDICARIDRIAERVNCPQGADIHRINDSVENSEEWRQGTVLKYASTPHPRTPARSDFGGQARAKG